MILLFQAFRNFINNIVAWTETDHQRYLLEWKTAREDVPLYPLLKTAKRISKIEVSYIFLKVNEVLFYVRAPRSNSIMASIF